jgi:hypothetical protein
MFSYVHQLIALETEKNPPCPVGPQPVVAQVQRAEQLVAEQHIKKIRKNAKCANIRSVMDADSLPRVNKTAPIQDPDLGYLAVGKIGLSWRLFCLHKYEYYHIHPSNLALIRPLYSCYITMLTPRHE